MPFHLSEPTIYPDSEAHQIADQIVNSSNLTDISLNLLSTSAPSETCFFIESLSNANPSIQPNHAGSFELHYAPHSSNLPIEPRPISSVSESKMPPNTSEIRHSSSINQLPFLVNGPPLSHNLAEEVPLFTNATTQSFISRAATKMSPPLSTGSLSPVDPPHRGRPVLLTVLTADRCRPHRGEHTGCWGTLYNPGSQLNKLESTPGEAMALEGCTSDPGTLGDDVTFFVETHDVDATAVEVEFYLEASQLNEAKEISSFQGIGGVDTTDTNAHILPIAFDHLYMRNATYN
ncbi:unnamed protein product [Protopolystoma xenopodis]|uniref:Uncharacterized protein n=1 Tax=Protopolystoma xenopodis TaxID=117903 RepID=A0A3S4ZUF3_9PLAT|nr:unnamed protein product [Protopolystoma xenopodis]